MRRFDPRKGRNVPNTSVGRRDPLDLVDEPSSLRRWGLVLVVAVLPIAVVIAVIAAKGSGTEHAPATPTTTEAPGN
jgi:hypothetical protein